MTPHDALSAIRLEIAGGPAPTVLATIARIDLLAAQGMSAGTAETLQAAQGDSPPARSRSDAPTLSAAPRSNPPTDGTGNKPSEQE